MVEREAPSYESATLVNIALEVLIRHQIPHTESIEQLKAFYELALRQVNWRDTPNHRSVRLWDTVLTYHPDLFSNISTLTPNEIETKLQQWLTDNKVDPDTAIDWFLTNICWEHIIGGGSADEIPECWKKYLQAEINGRTYGFPSPNSVRPWSHYSAEEQILAYRKVTNFYFVRTAVGLLYPNQDLNPAPTWALLNIQQIHSDRNNCIDDYKPLFSKAVDAFASRTSWSDTREAMLVAKEGGLPQIVAIPISQAARVSYWIARQVLIRFGKDIE